jgi:SNF2 family DNA or RNA helicase
MDLYEFQKEDVEKLANQRSVLIGSEMGTGKTHEAIALDEIWNPTGAKPTLVVAPLNTFDSWQEKYGIQSPRSDIRVIDRKNREAFYDAIRRKQGDVFLMHWDALRLMPELARIDLSVLVADEVHRASNRKAQATRALKKLRADHRLGLSGTATGDKPESLWSVNHWLWPSYYTSYWRFRHKYCLEEQVNEGHGHSQGYTKITGPNPDTIGFLHEEMDPWFVRHLKREPCCNHHPNGVMPWLKEKTYDKIWVDLNPIQKRLYEQMRKEMVAWVNEHEDTPLVASVVVAQMVRLSQIALATPSLTTDPFGQSHVKLTGPSSKIDAVRELILDHDNKQFVVFSSSKQACYLAQQEFARAGISAEVLSGDTSQRDRDGMVGRFNDGCYQVFIGVIQAAAEGIDGLQRSADTAIFLDRSWSTIKNKQAEDRLHRDLQENAVQIIDIMARGTLDFGRWQKLETKWSWIKAMLGDPGVAQVLLANGKELTE